MVQFTDKEASTDASSFDNLIFSKTSGTLWDYYKKVSYGNLDIVTVNLPSTIGWETAPQTYSYYCNGENGEGDYPHNSQKLVEDIVQLVNPYINFSDYDNDNDGYVDALFIVHSGPGAEYTGNNDDIWSHAWQTKTPQNVDDVIVSKYSIEPEYWSVPGDMTIGVYAHELGHAAFGLLDLYDTDNSSKGLGNWSLMAGGSWTGNNGDTPCFPDAWSQIQMGYVNPISITNNLVGQSILAIENSPQVYKLWKNGVFGNEYYLVENRQEIGYDAFIPGSGLAIFHVDDNVASNKNEWYPGNTTNGHYHVSLEQADGNWDLEKNINRGDSGDLYPGTSNNRIFNDVSIPNSSDYNNQTTNVSISNISSSKTDMTADLTIFQNTTNYSLSISPASQEKYSITGTEIPLYIKIGEPNAIQSPDNFYGVSFNLNWDNSQYIEYSGNSNAGSFLGNNPLTLIQSFSNHIEVGLTRTTGTGVTGSGTVLLCTLKVKSQPTNQTTVTLSLSNITATQSDGSSLNLVSTGTATCTLTTGVSVWPGDANNDGTANASDVLPLGLYYNKTGPSRSGGNSSWTAQTCSQGWNPANAVYADCNGDGTVNAADVLSIGLNYGKTHTTTTSLAKTNENSEKEEVNTLNSPYLLYSIYNINNKLSSINNLRTGDYFYLSVLLSDSKDILGISFSSKIDGIVGAEIEKSWGNNGVKYGKVWEGNKIYISRINPEEGKIDIGVTKTDKISLSEQTDVEILRVKMRVINKESLGFSFENVVANDKEGNEIKMKGLSLEKGLIHYVGNAPTEYQLSNYPNPFNPMTRIQIGIPEATEVSLIIYNSLGQEITRLAKRTMMDAGIYNYEWNASNMPSGIYFYQIKTNDYSVTKKMIY